jgi:hypothetical protein
MGQMVVRRIVLEVVKNGQLVCRHCFFHEIYLLAMYNATSQCVAGGQWRFSFKELKVAGSVTDSSASFQLVPTDRTMISRDLKHC